MKFRAVLMVSLAVTLLLCGCREKSGQLTPTEKVIDRIESGMYRSGTAPTILISTPKKLYRIGEDVVLSVRVSAPIEAEALDPYLPIRGRLHVKMDGALRELQPPPSSARLAWAMLPVDQKRERARVFEMKVNRVFPMTRTGWYRIWWEGTDDVGQDMRSSEAYVRVMVRVPE